LIVGKNGHGKSNLYSAIKFLLTIDDKDKITQEEKRGLLNEKLVEEELYVEATIANTEKNHFVYEK